MAQDFLTGLMEGVGPGVRLGMAGKAAWNDRKLRESMEEINSAQVGVGGLAAPAPAPGAVDANAAGLATPQQAPQQAPPGYNFGGKSYAYEPTPELQEAERTRMRAEALMKYGNDPARGMAWQEKYTEKLAKANEALIMSAFNANTPEALVKAWSLIDNGIDAEVRKGPNGIEVWSWPEGKRDAAELVMNAADEGTLVAQLKNAVSPKMVQDAADAELERLIKRAGLNKTRADTGRVGVMNEYTRAQIGRIDVQNESTAAQIQARFQKIQTDKMKPLVDAAKYDYERAVASDDRNAIVQTQTRLQQIQDLADDLISGVQGLGDRGSRYGAQVDLSAPAYGPYADVFEQAARRHGVPAVILSAIAEQESNFNPQAMGDHDAAGNPRSFGMGQFFTEGALRTLNLTPQQVLGASVDQQADWMAQIVRDNIKRSGGDVQDAIRRYNGSGKMARKYSNEVMNRIANAGGIRPPLAQTMAERQTRYDTGKPSMEALGQLQEDALLRAQQLAVSRGVKWGKLNAQEQQALQEQAMAEVIQETRARMQQYQTGQNDGGLSANPQGLPLPPGDPRINQAFGG
jgi:hypothetical protein